MIWNFFRNNNNNKGEESNTKNIYSCIKLEESIVKESLQRGLRMYPGIVLWQEIWKEIEILPDLENEEKIE